MPSLRRPLARARALPPLRLDALLAAVVVAEGLIESAALGHHGAAARTGYATVALIGGAVLLHRRSPWASLLLAFAGLMVGSSNHDYVDDIMGPFAAIVFVLVDLGGRFAGRRFYAAVAVSAVLDVVASVTDTYPDTLAGVTFNLLMLALAPMALGRFLRGRAELNRALQEKSEQLEREREERARLAVAEERTRIASELHDAISHALSGMIVQAAGARRSLPGHPERAREAFAAVEDAGREALTEMRLLLGVLRREDAELALAPQPSLAHLESLLARVREDGLPVEAETHGAAVELPAGVDLTAYRVVQEALSSAARAGGARSARVRLRFGGDRLDIEVADDGAAPGSRELMGIRERLTLYGGELTEAAEPAAGHVVRARIPLGAA